MYYCRIGLFHIEQPFFIGSGTFKGIGGFTKNEFGIDKISFRNRTTTESEVMAQIEKGDKQNVYVMHSVYYTDNQGYDEWYFTRQTVYYDDDFDNKWDITDKTSYGGGKYKTHENQMKILSKDEQKAGEYDDYWVHPDLMVLKDKPLKSRNFVYEVERYNSWDEYKKNY